MRSYSFLFSLDFPYILDYFIRIVPWLLCDSLIFCARFLASIAEPFMIIYLLKRVSSVMIRAKHSYYQVLEWFIFECLNIWWFHLEIRPELIVLFIHDQFIEAVFWCCNGKGTLSFWDGLKKCLSKTEYIRFLSIPTLFGNDFWRLVVFSTFIF